jgi:hypothetical protein
MGSNYNIGWVDNDTPRRASSCQKTLRLYAAALKSKGRLIRCTVAALTPNRLAILRTKVGPILAGPGLREARS